MQHLCKNCGNEIPRRRPRDRDKLFCDRKCAGIFLKGSPVIPCPQCNKPFSTAKGRKSCSVSCAAKIKQAEKDAIRGVTGCITEVTCQQCNGKFFAKNTELNRGKGLFCNGSCATRKFNFNFNYFENIDSCDKAYWLGFLLADGYQDGSEVVLNLQASDEDHLIKFKNNIESEHKIKIHYNGRKGCKHLTATFKFGSIKMCSDLNKLGCVRAKSHTVGFPDISNKFFPDLIRGIFDGDGCIYIANKKCTIGVYTIFSMSKDFIYSINEIFISIGIKSHIYRQNNGYKVSITNKDGIRKIFNYMYSENCVKMDRKFNKFLALIPAVEREGWTNEYRLEQNP